MRRSRDYKIPLLLIFIALLFANITIFALWALIPAKDTVATIANTPEFEEIFVPVTGFYNFETTDISSESLSSLEKITDPAIDPKDTNIYLISLDNLDSRVRVINVDGKYPLDVLAGDPEFLTINQTGVTALTRQMLTKLNVVGDGAYFAEKVADFLSSTDLTHISNEISFSDSCTNSIAMTLCSDPRMYSAITAIGTDIVELTGNHNNDWGKTANLETIEMYRDEGLLTFGGGTSEEDAAIPLEFKQDGTSITWIGINNSTSTQTNGQGAIGEYPGANIYNEAIVRSQIEEAKSRGDYIIIDVQFFECYSYPEDGEEMPSCDYPITGQEAFFKELIDMGADMVVGTQAHQPQTFELYHDKPIYYGLGNLFFDQTYWPGTMRSLILTHYFSGQKLLQTRITPTMYDRNYQTAIMSEQDSKNYLTRLAEASPGY